MVILPLCSPPIRSHLECCVQLWGTQSKKDVKLLECVQKRVKKDYWKDGTPIKRVRDLGLFSLDKSLYCDLSVLKVCLQEREGKTFQQSFCDRTKQNGIKPKEGQFRVYIRNKFFTKTVVKAKERVTQRSSRCAMPGYIQGQIGQGSEKPQPVEDIPDFSGWRLD